MQNYTAKHRNQLGVDVNTVTFEAPTVQVAKKKATHLLPTAFMIYLYDDAGEVWAKINGDGWTHLVYDPFA